MTRAWPAERVLAQPVVQQPDNEDILIQGHSPAQTYGQDPEFRQAVREVAPAVPALPQAATDIQSPLNSPGSLAAGRPGRLQRRGQPG